MAELSAMLLALGAWLWAVLTAFWAAVTSSWLFPMMLTLIAVLRFSGHRRQARRGLESDPDLSKAERL